MATARVCREVRGRHRGAMFEVNCEPLQGPPRTIIAITVRRLPLARPARREHPGQVQGRRLNGPRPPQHDASQRQQPRLPPTRQRSRAESAPPAGEHSDTQPQRFRQNGQSVGQRRLPDGTAASTRSSSRGRTARRLRVAPRVPSARSRENLASLPRPVRIAECRRVPGSASDQDRRASGDMDGHQPTRPYLSCFPRQR